MGKAMTSDVVQLLNWRLSFANLDKPKAFQPGQAEKYQATFLGDPSDSAQAAQILAIKEAAKALIKAQWGEKPAGLKLCFGLADENEVKKKYDGYAGMFYIVTGADADRKPEVYSRLVEPIAPGHVDENGSPDYPYNGCRVNTGITLWTQDNTFGKAIRANLRRVQFYKHDKAFGGGPQIAATEEFTAYKDEAKPAKVATAAAGDFDL